MTMSDNLRETKTADNRSTKRKREDARTVLLSIQNVSFLRARDRQTFRRDTEAHTEKTAAGMKHNGVSTDTTTGLQKTAKSLTQRSRRREYNPAADNQLHFKVR